MKNVLKMVTKLGLTVGACLLLVHLLSVGVTMFWLTLYTMALSVFGLKALGIYDCVDQCSWFK